MHRTARALHPFTMGRSSTCAHVGFPSSTSIDFEFMRSLKLVRVQLLSIERDSVAYFVSLFFGWVCAGDKAPSPLRKRRGAGQIKAGDKAPAYPYHCEMDFQRNWVGVGSIRDGYAVWTKGWSEMPLRWGLAAM